MKRDSGTSRTIRKYLICMSSIPEKRREILLTLFSFFKIILAMSSFAFSYKFWHNLMYVCKKLAGILIGYILNLYINWGRIDIFTLLNLLIHEHSISLPLFTSSLISFISVR